MFPNLVPGGGGQSMCLLLPMFFSKEENKTSCTTRPTCTNPQWHTSKKKSSHCVHWFRTAAWLLPVCVLPFKCRGTQHPSQNKNNLRKLGTIIGRLQQAAIEERKEPLLVHRLVYGLTKDQLPAWQYFWKFGKFANEKRSLPSHLACWKVFNFKSSGSNCEYSRLNFS